MLPLSLIAGQSGRLSFSGGFSGALSAAPSAVIDGSLRAACLFWRRGGAQSRSKDSLCAYATPPHFEDTKPERFLE